MASVSVPAAPEMQHSSLAAARRRQSASDSRRECACLGIVTVYAYAAGKVRVEMTMGNAANGRASALLVSS